MESYNNLLIQIKNEASYYNHILVGNFLPPGLWEPMPHILKTWLRNYITLTLLYFISGFLWCFYLYHLKHNAYIPKDLMPSVEIMKSHIMVSMKGMPWVTAVPTISEYLAENGWSKCFLRVDEVGWISYFIYVIAYSSIVEFLIYWVHRKSHEIKIFYKYVHAPHHIYNKKNQLSPFAGFAVHPVDGILLGLPHVVAIILVPTHYTTHLGLMFAESIWVANIHDCVDAKVWPIMGAGYHVTHHTKYRCNYGRYTVAMDWMFGTLRPPS